MRPFPKEVLEARISDPGISRSSPFASTGSSQQLSSRSHHCTPKGPLGAGALSPPR